VRPLLDRHQRSDHPLAASCRCTTPIRGESNPLKAERIGSCTDLYSAVADRTVTSVELELAGLDPVERALWQRRLNDGFGRRGCTEGTVGLSVGLIGSLAAKVFCGDRRLDRHAVLVVVAATIGAAALGKGIGMRVGRRRARRLAVEFEDVIRQIGAKAVGESFFGRGDQSIIIGSNLGERPTIGPSRVYGTANSIVIKLDPEVTR
jgi:hypothetical protein